MSRIERTTGVVKSWSPGGYGFIGYGGGDKEIWFHATEFVSDDGDPGVGDRVSFIESSGPDRRPRAKSVMPAHEF
jgi:cold shock CspA family protein